MTTTLTEFKTHRAGRIDQSVGDYFKQHPSVTEVQAKELMGWFIEKGIFKSNHRDGLPIRNILRELDAAGKLALLVHCKAVRKHINRNWYFNGSSSLIHTNCSTYGHPLYYRPDKCKGPSNTDI